MASRILVIDDDEAINDSLCELLSARGYVSEAAFDGQQALDLTRRLGFRPDAIILDLVMPVMDGIDFLRQRASEPLLATAPVIVLSAQTSKLVQAALEPYAVFTKPPRIDALLRAVDAACRGLPAPA